MTGQLLNYHLECVIAEVSLWNLDFKIIQHCWYKFCISVMRVISNSYENGEPEIFKELVDL